MARIRTVKPEWLEDEGLLRAGSDARVLSVALILLADDYGNGRCIPEVLAVQVFPFAESSRVFRESLANLQRMGFVARYRVRGQTYFHIRNWSDHQRVDKPGKPRVPNPETCDVEWLDIPVKDSRDSRENSRESRETLAPDPIRSDRDRDLACARESETRDLQPQGLAWQRVGSIYAERYTAETTNPVALDLYRESFEAIAFQASGDEAKVRGSLDNFWADEYARGCDWSPALWAKQFGRHLRGVSPPRLTKPTSINVCEEPIRLAEDI